MVKYVIMDLLDIEEINHLKKIINSNYDINESLIKILKNKDIVINSLNKKHKKNFEFYKKHNLLFDKFNKLIIEKEININNKDTIIHFKKLIDLKMKINNTIINEIRNKDTIINEIRNKDNIINEIRNKDNIINKLQNNDIIYV